MVSLKILVVDDNESDILLFTEALDSIVEYLRSKDMIVEFDVKQAYNGLEGYNLTKNDNFDLIFLDVKMPKMDGIEMLKKIKEDKVESNVIMFTTSSYEEDVLKSLNLGANAYVLKSLDIMEFDENLKTIIVLFIQDNFIFVNFNKTKNTIK